MSRVVNECSVIIDNLKEYFKNNSRISDIQLDRVRINSREGKYLLLNLSIDFKNYHSDFMVGFEKTDEEIFKLIVSNIKKFIKFLDGNNLSISKKVKKK